jgi:phage terminase small subunit
MPKPKTIMKTDDVLYEVSKRFEELKEEGSLADLEVEEARIGSQNLTYMQRIFVNHYSNTMNGTQAAIAAGCNPSTASVRAGQYLRTKKIQMAIIKRLNALSMITAINKEVVLVELFQIFQDLQAEPEKNRNMQLKVLELIAKMNGYYNPATQINVTDNSLDGIKIQIVTNEGVSNSRGIEEDPG